MILVDEPGKDTQLYPIDTSRQLHPDWRKRAIFGLVVLILLIWGIQQKRPEAIASFAGHTMGTGYQVQYVPVNRVHSDASLQAKIDSVLDLIVDLMSTYHQDSEIMRFNGSKVGVWFQLSPDTYAVVTQALELANISNGRFDPTVGPLISLWGIQQSSELGFSPPELTAVELAKQKVGWQYLDLDPVNMRIRKKRDLTLDLSAIAKGYAVDQVAQVLEESGVTSFLVEIGGELRSSGQKPNGQPWRIAVESPSVSGRDVERVLSLQGQSVASSGDYRNYRMYQGRHYGHIINPITGYPVEHALYSVTVVADTAMQADAWATALSVIGPKEGLVLAESYGLAVVFLMDEQGELVEYATESMRAFVDGPSALKETLEDT